MPSNKKIQITDAGGTNLLPHTSLDNLQVSKTDNTDITLVTEIGATGSTAALPTEHAVREALNEKQDTLIEGSNVSLHGNTISVPDASTSEKGAVQINTADSNGVSLDVNGGTVKVNAEKASADGFGTVRVNTSASNGVSLEVDGGTVKVNAEKASTDGFGTVKVNTSASNGVSLEVNGGTVKVNAAKASADAFGTVKVNTADSNGVSLEVDGGTVKVNAEKASTDAFGTVKVSTEDSNGVSLEVNGGTVKVNTAIATNTTPGVIAGASDGVKLVNGVAQFDVTTVAKKDGSAPGVLVDVGDGLLVDGGTVSINDAPVKDVLSGLDEGAAINDEVVTPGNLNGALSLGQANDVSCKPYSTGTITYTNPSADASVAFLSGFTCALVNGTTVGYYDTGSHKFPKFAPNRTYLLIADVSGSGTVTPNGGSAITLTGTPQRIAIKITAADNGWISASTSGSMVVANWRQYAVSGMSDEAIEFLASAVTNPDPDSMFRTTALNGVLSRYLIKQNMVAPWMNVITMGDNANLTVAAGSNYKIKYTNDSPHTVSVDTFPNGAYGWDAHVQMFIKGTSGVVFQPPLILMDALTPNSGHNLLVKFRNGQALVYVEDTDAGYIVISATGTTSGTLAYGFTQADTEYIVFGSTVNGLVCDFGTVTPVYGATMSAINLLGNGTDQTSIAGTLAVPSGKTVNLQDLSITGSTINGAGDTVLISARVDDTMDVATTAKFSGVAIVDGTISGAGMVYALDGSTVTSTIPDGSTIGTGIITGLTASSYMATGNAIFENLTISNIVPVGNVGIARPASGKTIVFKNCHIAHAGGDRYMQLTTNGTLELNKCVTTGATDGSRFLYVSTSNCTLKITDSDISATTINGNTCYVAGTTYIHNLGIGASNSTNTIGIVLMDGAVLSVDTISYRGILKGGMTVDGSATIIIAGQTESISGCSFYGPSDTGVLVGNPNETGTITLSAMDLWSADGAIFGSPVDASAVCTVKLSNTTFTAASLITGQPERIQITADTISLSGNTNAENTKILQAPIIVVGDNAAAPSGSATLVNAAGTTSTISGIGTFIDKEGDNDFRPVTSNFNVSNTASSGAGSLLDRLTSASAQATTSSMQQFVGFVSGGTTGVASAAADTAIVSTTIITKDYQPVLGGNYTVSAGGVMTVDQATRTATIASAIMRLVDAAVPGGATLAVSSGGGGGLVIEKVTGNGGTIDLGGTNIVLSSGGTAYASGCTFTNGAAPASGGVMIVSAGASARFVSCVISGNAGTRGALAGAGSYDISGCTITENTYGGYFGAASTNIVSSIVSGNSAYDIRIGGGQVVVSDSQIGYVDAAFNGITLTGMNTVGRIGGSNGSAIISSGAIIDLTGNTNATPIKPGGGITFGANVTVINSAGSSGLLNGGEAGTCTKINNDGTVD